MKKIIVSILLLGTIISSWGISEYTAFADEGTTSLKSDVTLTIDPAHGMGSPYISFLDTIDFGTIEKKNEPTEKTARGTISIVNVGADTWRLTAKKDESTFIHENAILNFNITGAEEVTGKSIDLNQEYQLAAEHQTVTTTTGLSLNLNPKLSVTPMPVPGAYTTEISWNLELSI